MQTLLSAPEGPILTLTLNQPTKLNPLDLPQSEELAHALAYARGRDNIRTVVLTGSGAPLAPAPIFVLCASAATPPSRSRA